VSTPVMTLMRVASANPAQQSVLKGHNATRDDIRQPVSSKPTRSTRQTHGDGYFHQDR
jgi:hypothetical protein